MLSADERQWLPGVYKDGVFIMDAAWTDAPGGVVRMQFGAPGDTPVLGDWDGDSLADPGVRRGSTFYLDTNQNNKWDRGIDQAFSFGAASDLPVVGRWHADLPGDRVGIFHDGYWWLDSNGNTRADEGDLSFYFGQAGDIPVTGDWNADGVTDIGVYRGNTFLLDFNGNHTWDGDEGGYKEEQPWDGKPFIQPFIDDEAINIGLHGDTPITSSRYEVLSVYRNGTFYNDRDKSKSWGIGDSAIPFNRDGVPVNGLFMVPPGTGNNSNAGFGLVKYVNGKNQIVPANAISTLSTGSAAGTITVSGGSFYIGRQYEDLPDRSTLIVGDGDALWLGQGTEAKLVLGYQSHVAYSAKLQKMTYDYESFNNHRNAFKYWIRPNTSLQQSSFTIDIKPGGGLKLNNGVKLLAGKLVVHVISTGGKMRLDPAKPPMYSPLVNPNVTITDPFEGQPEENVDPYTPFPSLAGSGSKGVTITGSNSQSYAGSSGTGLIFGGLYDQFNDIWMPWP